MIRRASENDIERILELLHQVNMVHFEIRPDLFKPNTTKYNGQELEALFDDVNSPIFVYDDGAVLGYAFCQVKEVKDNILLQDIKTLYIDDIAFMRRHAASTSGKRCLNMSANMPCRLVATTSR